MFGENDTVWRSSLKCCAPVSLGMGVGGLLLGILLADVCMDARKWMLGSGNGMVVRSCWVLGRAWLSRILGFFRRMLSLLVFLNVWFSKYISAFNHRERTGQNKTYWQLVQFSAMWQKCELLLSSIERNWLHEPSCLLICPSFDAWCISVNLVTFAKGAFKSFK